MGDTNCEYVVKTVNGTFYKDSLKKSYSNNVFQGSTIKLEEKGHSTL